MVFDAVLLNRRYRVGERLGEGGMGTVYRAYDRLGGREVAIKRVNIGEKAGNVALCMALAHEFRLLASLRHPNIINVSDYGFDENGQPYYVMALIDDARTIRQAADERDWRGKVKLLIDVLQALVYLHRHHILHRDIKPDNVLIDRNDQVCLVDFGLSVESIEGNYMSGTLAYMPPEAFLAQPLTAAADQYSVGVIAYELFAGALPFDMSKAATFFQQVLYAPPDLTPLAPLGDGLALVIARLLAKDPEDRYADADEAIRALCQAADMPLPEETRGIRESFLGAAKFVGREPELAALTSALNAPTGSAWLVGGEAGVGKSRLIEEVRTQALVKGITVMRGQAVEGGGLPCELLRDVLPLLLLGCELSPLEAGVFLPLMPSIARLLECEVVPAPELDPALTAARLKNTLLDVFRRQDQPILLILEDLHWGQDTFDLIQPLIGLQTKYPLVIVATYRSDEMPHLPERFPGMNPLLLSRLSAQEVAALAESMLAESDPALVSYLLNQTEGNAFFIVDVLQTLAEDAGRLDAIEQAHLSESLLSEGVLSVARRRLARIPAAHHRALRLAAVIGRELDSRLLTNAAWIDQGIESAILEVNGGRLCFAHDRIREGILRQTDPDLLRQLHGEAARLIEAAYGDDERYTFVLAKHWAAANEAAKEADYTLKAGAQAVKLNQYTSAQAYFERALALLPPDDPRGFEAVEALGKLYHTIGKFEEAGALYERLLARPHIQHMRRVDALITLADSMRRCGDLVRAETLANEADALAQASGYAQGQARALTARAHIRLNQEAFDPALTLLDEAIRLYAQIGGDAQSEYDLIRMQLAVYFAQSNILKVIELSELCLVKSRALGSPNRVALDLNNLGVVNMLMQNYAVSRAYFEQAQAMAAEIGNTWVVALTESNLTYNTVQDGDLVAALKHFARTVKLAHDYHILHLINGAVFLAAMIKRLIGERVTALAWMGVALREAALEPDVRRLTRLMVDALRDELPADEYARGVALGESLTTADVYAVIRAELLPPT